MIPNVPHADFVTVEPHTVDDWEILELNSEHAEKDILTQVLFLFLIAFIFLLDMFHTC